MLAPVEGALTLSVEDFVQGERDKPEFASLRRLLFPAAVLYLIVGLMRLSDPRDPPGLFGLGALESFAGSALFALLGWFTPSLWRAKRRFAKLGHDEREVRYRFDANGAHIRTRATDLSLPYGELKGGYSEGKHAFLLYLDRDEPQVVPKRAFPDVALLQVRSWLEASAPPHMKVTRSSRFAAIGGALLVLLVLAFATSWLQSR